ncbi:phosphoribosylpyrophosphate synthetase [Pontibacter sp. G13]|uniref:phosphoribosylpyrophosphate synthetase n=1 Tax=Pontibacter sp. G13 TaxID=3074898 RepID=UPI00288992CA|nr:phosphoribosylpyrophosphate synthetase [Pontibacter sp. G13]WNJ16361.1 phosphoribosylpyrophosphate synthetase [Pontibacter sp. G13]
MNQQQGYQTLSEAVNDLQARGYAYDFSLKGDLLTSKNLGAHFRKGTFTVREVHRFEGMSDPSDNSVVYAIETNLGVKGVLIDGYGIYADPASAELIAHLNMQALRGSDEQTPPDQAG